MTTRVRLAGIGAPEHNQLYERKTLPMYTLRYPIKLTENYMISASDEQRLTIEGMEIELLQDAGYHVIIVSGLDSAEMAVEFGTRLWVAISWALLNRATGFQVNGEPSIERLYDNPEQVGKSLHLNRPVDVVIDTAFPAIYPTDARIARITAGSAHGSQQLAFESFATDLTEGLSVATSASLPKRLRTAIDLFHTHYFELSDSARLLTLVMAMEVLSEGCKKHPVAIEILDNWGAEIRALRATKNDPEVDFALECLEREVVFRCEDSLRSRVRRMTLDALCNEGEETRAKLGRSAVEIYDSRSKLVHDGFLAPDRLISTLTEARGLVAMILRELIRAENPKGA